MSAATPLTAQARSTTAPDASATQPIPRSIPIANGTAPASNDTQSRMVLSGPSALASLQFSASTEEILKRISANASANAGTPGWEAARQRVLQTMVTSDNLLPTSSPINGKRKRGAAHTSNGGRGSSSSTPAPVKTEQIAADMSAAPATPVGGGRGPRGGRPRGPGRGSARGRGRGGAKGGKRKREDSSELTNDDSDTSEQYTPLITMTKSGRNIQKPTAFSPAVTASSSTPKRRKPSKRASESSVCKVCLRGQSPIGNMIVFCDGCNTPYHQYCHHPPISDDIIAVEDTPWYCDHCTQLTAKRKTNSRTSATPLETETPGGGLGESDELTLREKRSYLETLDRTMMIDLLLQFHLALPRLSIFPPDLRARLAKRATNAAVAEGAQTQSNERTARDINLNGAGSRDSGNPLPPIHGLIPDLTAGDRSLPTAAPSAAATDHDINVPEASHGGMDGREEREDEYDGYVSDMPAGYPKPGYGIASRYKAAEEDLAWLVDSNDDVFDDLINDGNLGVGDTSVRGEESENGSETLQTGVAAAQVRGGVSVAS